MMENGGWGGNGFHVFPNIRNCPAPCGNGYHRFGVVDSLESHHYSVETHGRASLQSPVCMDSSCVHAIVAHAHPKQLSPCISTIP